MLLYRNEDDTVIMTYDVNALGKAYVVYTRVDGRLKPYMWFNTVGEAFAYYEKIIQSKERMICNGE